MDNYIRIKGAREHNLKNINLDLPKNSLVVISGVSGSGKSSLAFDTIYAEGQRRYVESLSAYARQFLDLQNKPDVDHISGLSPAIAIDQKTTARSPRSTVGTITEIYDYLRLLFARVGVPYSPTTGLPIQSQTVSQMVDIVKKLPADTKLHILSPLIRGGKGEHKKELLNFRKLGFQRVVIDRITHDLDNLPEIDKNKKHDIELLVDRIVISENLGNRLYESVETALKYSEGLCVVELISEAELEGVVYEKGHRFHFSERYSCPDSGFQLEEIEPRIFSFNSPFGACKECEGLGTEVFFDENLIIPDEALSLREGAIAPWGSEINRNNLSILENLAKKYNFSLDVPYHKLDEDAKSIILHGEKRSTNERNVFAGILYLLERRWSDSTASWIKEELSKYQSKRRCESCNGYRLKKENLSVKIEEMHIGQVSEMTISAAKEWFDGLENKLGKKSTTNS